MTATPQRRPAHLTLVELLIAVLLVGVAAFFVVRNMQQAKERAQLAALTSALGKEDTDAVWNLCKANPKLIHAKDAEYGWTPLHLAAGRGNKEMAQWLLDHSAEVSANDSVGRTPLHVAAGNNHKEIAELLLAKGAEINAKVNDGWTPLHYAANNNKKEVSELLLAKGADINAKSNDGFTPLDYAFRDGPSQVADLLRKHGAKDEEAAPVAPAAEK